MAYLQLSKGKHALIDDEDFEWLNQWKWHTTSVGYAARRQYGKGHGKSDLILMHRLLMNFPRGMEVDHINNDKLDNRRNNLRAVTRSQNACNMRTLRTTNTSGYRGVTWEKRKRKWQAQIKLNYKNHFLGYFDDIVEAARVRDEASLKYHGEYTPLNTEKA